MVALALTITGLPAMGDAAPGEHDAHAGHHADHAGHGPSSGRPVPGGVTARVEVPDVELVDQHGARVRVGDLLGGEEVVVVDFVYTTCTTVCPVLSAIMGRLQARLGDRLGRGVRMVSITVDPVRDTPARLQAYAAKHGARPGWTWLTGSPGDVERVLRGMGAYTASFVDHPPMVLVGGRGTWSRFNGFPDPDQVLARVEELGKRSAAVAPAQGAEAAPPPATGEAKARAYFTDTELVDQDGRPVRFYEDVLKGKVVVVSFMFTRCTSACPLLAVKLNAVRRELGDEFGKSVHFVTLTVDPEFDTPAQWRKFARAQRAEHPGWTFLTGESDAVQLVLRKLGERGEAPDAHSTGFLAANVARGHWTRIRPDATAPIIVQTVRQLAAPTP